MALEKPTSIGGFLAVCDAAFLSSAGIPTVIYGPSGLSQAHAINEYVTVKEVMDATKSLALAIMM